MSISLLTFRKVINRPAKIHIGTNCMTIRNNTLWSLAGSGLPLIAAAALIPFTLKILGNETFGVLTLVWVLIGYLSLFDMGVGRSLTYELSQLKAENKPHEIAQTLKAGVYLTLITGLVGAGAIWLLAPYLSTWLKISPHIQADATSAFRLCALAVIPTTITSGLRGGLEGLGDFAASNIIKLIIGFSMFTMPTIVISLHGASIAQITLYLSAVRVIVLLLAVWQLRRYLTQALGINITPSNIKQIFKYGVWVTLTGIVGPIMVYGDRFLVSNLLGAAELPFYAIPQEGLLRLLIIPAAFGAALMPLLSSAKLDDLSAIYHAYFNKIAKLMLAVCTLSAVCAYPFLAVWLSPTFAQKAIVIVLILLVGVFLNSLSIVPYTLVQARGKPKLTALYHLAELTIYIPLIWVLVSHLGLVGAASAWVIRVIIDFALLQHTAKQLSKHRSKPISTLVNT